MIKQPHIFYLKGLFLMILILFQTFPNFLVYEEISAEQQEPDQRAIHQPEIFKI
jgi:hypothetical protein